MFHIYSKPACAACYKAKALLDIRGIKYKEDIIGIHIMRESFLEMFPNVRQVPLILKVEADGFNQVIGSFEELQEYLKNDQSGSGELLQG